jgi:hypothetical protein
MSFSSFPFLTPCQFKTATKTVKAFAVWVNTVLAVFVSFNVLFLDDSKIYPAVTDPA